MKSSCKKLDTSKEDDKEFMELIISKEDDSISKGCWQEATK